MKHLGINILLAIILLLPAGVMAQKFNWVKRAGSASSNQSLTAIGSSPTDTTVVSASIGDSVTIDGTKYTAKGGNDILLYGFLKDGTKKWNPATHFVSGGAKDEVKDISYSNSSGHFYFTGQLDDTNRVGSHTNIFGPGSYFLSKLNATSGNIDWVVPNKNLSKSIGKSVTTDNAGNVYVLGEFFDSLRLSGSVFYKDSGLGDVFVAKYNSSGVFQWSDRIYSHTYVEGTAIRFDGTNVVVVGNFENKIHFGNASTSLTPDLAGKKDVFIVRYSLTGTRISPTKLIRSNDDVISKGMAINSNKEVVVVGGFLNSFTAGSSNISSNGKEDIFVVKCNSSNAVQWARGYGGSLDDAAAKTFVTNSGIVLIYGSFESTSINFAGTSVKNNASQDVFILALDSSGSQFGAHGGLMTFGTDIMNSLSMAGSNSRLYLGGSFRFRAKFGTLGNYDSKSFAFYDGFITQIKSSSVYCDFNDTLVTSSNFRTISADSFRLCDKSVGVIRSKAKSPFTFQWYQNGNLLSGATLDSLEVSAQGDYHLELTLSSRGCSESTDTLNIAMDSLPTVQVVADSICMAPGFQPISLTPSFTFGASTISGRGVVGFPPQYQASSAGVGVDTVIYSFKNAFNCTGVDTAIFVVHANPQILANNFSEYCVGDVDDTLRFDTTHIFSSWKYSMTPTNGIANDSVFRPSVLLASNHTVKYEVVDTNACKVDTSVSIKVNPLPNVSLNLSPNRVCRNRPLFSVGGASPVGGVFSGNGITDSIKGDYLASQVVNKFDTVVYTTSNSFGCVASDSGLMQIDTVPIVTLTLPTKVCESDSLVALSGGLPIKRFPTENSQYKGQYVSGKDFYPSLSSSGKHDVSYLFTDIYGCTDSILDSINVNVLPVVTLLDQGKHCENDSAFKLIGGSPLGGAYYFHGKVVADTMFNPAGKGVIVGLDSIYYEYVDTNTCSGIAGNKIEVIAKPRIQFPSLPFSPICNNAAEIDLLSMGDTLMSPPPSNGGWFTFDFVNPVTVIKPSDFVPLGDSTIAFEELFYMYTDPNLNCSDTASQSFTVNSSPIVEIIGASAVCDGLPTELLGKGGILYSWSTGDSGKSITFRQSVATTYMLTVTNFNRCQDSTSKTVEMTEGNEIPAIRDSTTINKGSEVYLDVLERNYSTSTIDLIGEFRVIVEPTNAEQYLAEVGISADHNSRFYYKPLADFRRIDSLQYTFCDATCPNICDSAKVIFNVLGDPYEFIPNGFSPNGDGLNDVWVVPGIELYPENELFIYNRWGDLVYESAPYNNDWEGQINTGLKIGGSTVVDGTYYYVLKMGDGDPIKGTIELKSR